MFTLFKIIVLTYVILMALITLLIFALFIILFIFAILKQVKDKAKKNRQDTIEKSTIEVEIKALKALNQLKKFSVSAKNLKDLENPAINSTIKQLLAENIVRSSTINQVFDLIISLRNEQIDGSVKGIIAKGVVRKFPARLPDYLELIANNSVDKTVRRNLLEALSEIASYECTPRLLELFRDESIDADVRNFILKTLASLKVIEILPDIISELEDLRSLESRYEYPHKSFVQDALSQFEDQNLTPFLFKLLKDRSAGSQARKIALNILASFKTPELISELIEILNDHSQEIRLRQIVFAKLQEYDEKKNIPEFTNYQTNSTFLERLFFQFSIVKGGTFNFQKAMGYDEKEKLFKAFFENRLLETDLDSLRKEFVRTPDKQDKILLGRALLKASSLKKSSVLTYKTRQDKLYKLFFYLKIYSFLIIFVVLLIPLIILSKIWTYLNNQLFRLTGKKLSVPDKLKYYLGKTLMSWSPGIRSVILPDFNRRFGSKRVH